MNKNTFNEIIRLSAHPEKSSDYHALLDRALKKYPYASILHITAARMNGSALGDLSEEILEAALNRVSDPRLIFEQERSFSNHNVDSDDVPPSSVSEVNISPIIPSVSFTQAEEETEALLEINEESVTEQVREGENSSEENTEDMVVSEEVSAEAEIYDEKGTVEIDKEKIAENGQEEGNIIIQNIEKEAIVTDQIVVAKDISHFFLQPVSDTFEQKNDTSVSGEKAGEFLNAVRRAVADFKEYEKNCLKKLLKETKHSSERTEKKKNEELKQLRKLRKKKLTENRAVIEDMLAKMVSEVDRFTQEDSQKLLSALLENYAEQGKKERKSKRWKENGKQILKATSKQSKHVEKPLSPSQKFLKPIRVSREPAVDAEDRPDLSLKSVKINEGLISENLAKILSKQGKMVQAVEMYKRLGLKYPEKKAYFADIVKKLEG